MMSIALTSRNNNVVPHWPANNTTFTLFASCRIFSLPRSNILRIGSQIGYSQVCSTVYIKKNSGLHSSKTEKNAKKTTQKISTTTIIINDSSYGGIFFDSGIPPISTPPVGLVSHLTDLPEPHCHSQEHLGCCCCCCFCRPFPLSCCCMDAGEMLGCGVCQSYVTHCKCGKGTRLWEDAMRLSVRTCSLAHLKVG